MYTPVYIKMDAADQLLLAEGVCRQLGIVTYHADVETWRGGSKQQEGNVNEMVTVPSVRASMLQSVRVLPHQSALVTAKVDRNVKGSTPFVLQPEISVPGVQAEESLLTIQDDVYPS